MGKSTFKPKKNSFVLTSADNAILPASSAESATPKDGSVQSQSQFVLDESYNDAIKKKDGGSVSSPTESSYTSLSLEGNPFNRGSLNGNPQIIQDKSDFLDRDIDLSQSFRLSTPTVGADQDKFSLKNLSITDREGHDLSNNQAQRNNQRQLIKSDSDALKKYHEQRIAELNDEIRKTDQQKSRVVPRTGDEMADAALMESGTFTKDLDDKIANLNTYKSDLKNSIAQRVISIELPKYDLTKVAPVDLGRKVVSIADPEFEMRLKEAESGGHALPGVTKADLERFGITAAKQYLQNNTNIPDRDKAISYLNSYESDFDERNYEQTWSRVKDKIGSFFYRQGGFNSGGTFGYSRDALTKAVNDPELNLSPSEKKVALNYGIPLEEKLIGTDIPGSGFFRSFKNAVERSSEGIGNTILSAVGARTDADRAYELLNAETGASRFANVGNNARGISALANLNTIEKTRPLTPQEQKQKQDLQNYVDVRNWGSKFLDGVGDLTGQVGVMALLSTATGGIGRGLTAAGDLSALGVTSSAVGQALSNPSVGLFLSGYLNSYDNYKKQAVELIPNPEQSSARNSYAATMAAVEGLSERIFNEAALVRNLTGSISPTVANITRRLSAGTISNQLARDEFQGALKTYLTKFGKGYLRSTAQESTEEAVVDIAQGISDSVFGGKDFDAYKTGKQAVTTFLTTALYSPVVAGLAAHGNYRQQTAQNQLLRSSILDMAANPTEYLRSVEQLQLGGEITQQEANDKIKLINSAKNYLQELPETRPVQQRVNENGQDQTIEAPRGFDSPEMTSYILHRMNEGIINEQLANSTDEVQKKQLERDLKRSQDIRQGIYDGSIGVSPELQEVTENPEAAAELGILPADRASDEQLIGTPFEREQNGDIQEDTPTQNEQSTAEAAPMQERLPQDLSIDELRALPFANESDLGQRALDQLDTIDFNDTDNIRNNVADLLAITESKIIPDNKLEQVLRGKSKLIGNEDFFTRDYLEKYILFSTKDFSNINTQQNENSQEKNNSEGEQVQGQSTESVPGISNEEGDVVTTLEGEQNVDTPITNEPPSSDITDVSEPGVIPNEVQPGQKVNFGGKEWDIVEDRGETVRISDPETNSVTSIPKQEALSRLVPSEPNTQGGQNATQSSEQQPEQEGSAESSESQRSGTVRGEQEQAQEGAEEQGSNSSDSVRGGEAQQEETVTEEQGTPLVGVNQEKNRETREELGLDDYERTRISDDEINQRAEQEIKKGYDVKKLLARLKDGKSTPSTLEVAILRKYKATLEAALERNPTKEVLADLRELVTSLDPATSEQGRAFRMLQYLQVRDNTLAGFFSEEQEASGREELTEEEIERVKKEWEDIDEVERKLNERIIALEAENARLKAEKELKKQKGEKTKKKSREEFKEGVQDAVAAAREKLKKLRGNQNVTIVPYAAELIAIAPEVIKVVRLVIEQGITELSDVVSNVHSQFKDIVPDLTEKDVHDIIAGEYNQAPPPRSEIAAKLRDLRDQAALINKLEALENGEIPKNEKAKAKRIAEIESLKKQIKEHNTTRLETYKSNLRRQIDELQEQLNQGNYRGKPGQPAITLDKEANYLKDKLIRLRNERQARLLRLEYQKSSRIQKIKDGIANVLNVPRGIMASLDFSAPLRQAAIVTVNNPKTAGLAGLEMFKQAFSQKRFDRWFYDLQNTPRYRLMQESGLYVADPNDPRMTVREEQFMSNLAEKIPVVGKLVKGSERAYVSYLNKMRVDLFNRYADAYEDQGFTFDSNPSMFEGIASFLNNATGRGNLGLAETAAPILNTAFFSPRLIASRMNILGLGDLFSLGNGYYSKLPPAVRVTAIRNLLQFIAIGATTISLIALANNAFSGDDEKEKAQIETDPRSSDFGKLKIGNTRWDVWAGFQQYVRLLAQLTTGQTKSVSSGKINDLGGEGQFGKTRADQTISFVRGKLAPVPSFVWDRLSGRTVMGEKKTLGESVRDRLLPLTVSDTYSAIKENGIKALFNQGIPASFGVGVQNYLPNGFSEKDLKKPEYKFLYDKNISINPPAKGEMTEKQYEDFLKERKVTFESEWNNVLNYGAMINENGNPTVNSNDAVDIKKADQLTYDELTKLMKSINNKASRQAKKDLNIQDDGNR